MEEKIVLILNEMSEYLSIAQMKKLQEVVLKTFSENEADKQEISNNDFLKGVRKEQYSIIGSLWNIYFQK